MRPPRLIVALLAASGVLVAACNVTVQINEGAWTAQCTGVASAADCKGIAAVFANNLAWSHDGVREESGSRIQITPAQCPTVNEDDEATWADLSACWRAMAPTRHERACMLIARQKHLEQAPSPFGQVGGDNYTGLMGAPKPGTTPC